MYPGRKVEQTIKRDYAALSNLNVGVISVNFRGQILTIVTVSGKTASKIKTACIKNCKNRRKKRQLMFPVPGSPVKHHYSDPTCEQAQECNRP